jgi:hypothetical protein
MDAGPYCLRGSTLTQRLLQMRWLILLPFLTSIAAFAACREQRASRRDGRRSLEGLSREDQRQIWRAFLGSSAVQDARLGAATVAWTQTLDEPCRWEDVHSAVWLGWITIVCISAMIAEEWRTAAGMLLVFDFFALAIGGGVIARRKTKEMERATLSFLRGAPSLKR